MQIRLSRYILDLIKISGKFPISLYEPQIYRHAHAIFETQALKTPFPKNRQKKMETHEAPDAYTISKAYHTPIKADQKMEVGRFSEKISGEFFL